MSAKSCQGCIYARRKSWEHPCSACSRLFPVGCTEDHYKSAGGHGLPIRQVSGQFRLVDKGSHYELEKA